MKEFNGEFKIEIEVKVCSFLRGALGLFTALWLGPVVAWSFAHEPTDASATPPEAGIRLAAAEVPANSADEPAKPKAGAPAKPEKAGAESKNDSDQTQSEPGWQSLFDGRTLYGWKPTDFAGHGEVRVENRQIILEMGNDMTGVTWTNPLAKIDYEVQLDAMRVEGSDFFCGLTFPVKDSPCSLIVGGWGGGVVGLSSLDGMDASENETTRFMSFENKRWYHIRLRVTRTKIQAWIDKNKVVDVSTVGRRIGIRIEVELSRPFGLSSWRTTAALRNLQIRRLEPSAESPESTK